MELFAGHNKALTEAGTYLEPVGNQQVDISKNIVDYDRPRATVQRMLTELSFEITSAELYLSKEERKHLNSVIDGKARINGEGIPTEEERQFARATRDPYLRSVYRINILNKIFNFFVSPMYIFYRKNTSKTYNNDQ